MQLITKNFKTFDIEQIIESLTEPANTVYYMTIGRHLPYANNDAQIETPVDSDAELGFGIYQNMEFAKQITENDMAPMIRRIDWAANTVFDMYEDDVDLSDKQFYCIVDETTQFHVFKCLYNAGGEPSTIAPDAGETSPADVFYETSDGYVWKFLYTVPSTTVDKFATTSYFPLVENANVTANAVAGTIDVISVVSGGSGYANYLSGQFNGSDIQVGGNTFVYAVANTGAVSNGFYTGCYLYLTSGTGAGQYRKISDYRIVGSSKQVTLETSLTTVPDATTTYEISPQVFIVGDSGAVTNAAARAIIDAGSNTVSQVEILNRGAGYRAADATVVAANVVGVSNTAVLKPIISPQGGHGAYVQRELFADRLCFSVKFEGDESGLIPAENTYRTVGILRDPEFAVLELQTLDSDGSPGSNGTFVVGENIYEYRAVKICGAVTTEVGNTVIQSAEDAGYTDAFDSGDRILITDGEAQLFSTVASVANNTTLTLDDSMTFASANARVHTVDTYASAIASSKSVGTLGLRNAVGFFTAGTKVFGDVSSATATIDSLTINGDSKTFSVLTQMNRYVGSLSGTFNANETVYQGALSVANAVLHSVETANGVSTVYVTNQLGIINTSNTIVGANSGAILSITAKYQGDIVPDSGSVIYIENIAPITRTPAQTETVKVIIGH